MAVFWQARGFLMEWLRCKTDWCVLSLDNTAGCSVWRVKVVDVVEACVSSELGSAGQFREELSLFYEVGVTLIVL
jgi:hypothetical protein